MKYHEPPANIQIQAGAELARLVELVRFTPGQTSGYLHSPFDAQQMIWRWFLKWLALAPRPKGSACTWADDDDGVYGTTCGHAFQFNDEGPRLNGFKWCPYCGATLEEANVDPLSPPTEAVKP